MPKVTLLSCGRVESRRYSLSKTKKLQPEKVPGFREAHTLTHTIRDPRLPIIKCLYSQEPTGHCFLPALVFRAVGQVVLLLLIPPFGGGNLPVPGRASPGLPTPCVITQKAAPRDQAPFCTAHLRAQPRGDNRQKGAGPGAVAFLAQQPPSISSCHPPAPAKKNPTTLN